MLYAIYLNIFNSVTINLAYNRYNMRSFLLLVTLIGLQMLRADVRMRMRQLASLLSTLPKKVESSVYAPATATIHTAPEPKYARV